MLLKKHKLHLSCLFSYNHTCFCVNMVSVTSASRYHPHYQSRSSMYIRGLILRNFAEFAEAAPILIQYVNLLPTIVHCYQNAYSLIILPEPDLYMTVLKINPGLLWHVAMRAYYGMVHPSVRKQCSKYLQVIL